MSLFDTFRKGLTKTRDFMTSSFNRMAAGLGVFDDDMLDELESIVVQGNGGLTA